MSHFDNLSDEELEQFLLEMLEKMGSPGFPPGMDTSREGLLDFIAGISAIANATPADEP
ncbi:hypothetical protein [Nostoc sp. DedVER01b]|uniref:hypothetical protein n=1 Tax=Nostoc sp. DedVER01b TaxID=3075404 RepID=UPI003D161AB1